MPPRNEPRTPWPGSASGRRWGCSSSSAAWTWARSSATAPWPWACSPSCTRSSPWPACSNGSASWLTHVEFFTVFFGLLARFAPLEVTDGRVYLRPLGAGLLDRARGGWDRVLFVILMLSTLAFDALVLTPVWSQVV